MRFKETETHTGEFRGLAPTDKKITFAGVIVYRIVDGKVTESWGVYDLLDFYKQLGVIEYTEKAKKLFQGCYVIALTYISAIHISSM